MIRKERGFFVGPIAILVFQHPDAPSGFAVVIHTTGIVRHLHDPQPAGKVPIQGDRVDHIGFTGHQLHLEAFRNPDGFQTFLRRQGGELRGEDCRRRGLF